MGGGYIAPPLWKIWNSEKLAQAEGLRFFLLFLTFIFTCFHQVWGSYSMWINFSGAFITGDWKFPIHSHIMSAKFKITVIL